LICLTYTNYLPHLGEGIRRHRATFEWWTTVRLNVFIAIGVFLLLVATNQTPLDAASVIRTLFATTVYTFCIGTPAFYVITQFIEPMPVRSKAMVWSFVILSCLGLAVFGAAIAETILQASGMFPDQGFRLRFVGGLKISLVVSSAAGIGKYIYDHMQQRLQRQNIELQKTIETGSARARLQEEDFQEARQSEGTRKISARTWLRAFVSQTKQLQPIM
jgi:hypothetical protein